LQESIKINTKNLQIFIMKPAKIQTEQNHLFKNRLSNQINMRHELVILSKVINWDALETELGSLHEDTIKGGQPPKPVRLMVGLLLLEYLKNLSDEEVVRSWVENPYWQYFCGYDFLQLKMPIDPYSLTRWRNRLGPEKLEKILGMSVKAAVDTGAIKQEELKTVIVDTNAKEYCLSY
jgi:IS5 family transposase